DPAQLRANLSAVLDTLRQRDVPVLLAGMLAPRNYGSEYSQAFAAAFADLGEKATVFYPFFLEGVATVPALNQSDGIHPNAEGVEAIVGRILPYVEKLLAATDGA
ncbi:MAG: arylesterase, partial [Acetobacterales bacterium]